MRKASDPNQVDMKDYHLTLARGSTRLSVQRGRPQPQALYLGEPLFGASEPPKKRQPGWWGVGWFRQSLPGSNPDLPNAKGVTPLEEAVQEKNFKKVRFYLNMGADPNRVDLSGSLPLNQAIRSGDVGCVEALLSFGADPNRADSQWDFPLLQAIELSNPETMEKMVRALLIAGADPNRTTEIGSSVLYQIKNLPQVVALLQKMGGEVHMPVSLWLSHRKDPAAFWRHWQQYQHKIPMKDLEKLFFAVENNIFTPHLGLPLLPELLAILDPYLRQAQGDSFFTHAASEAITHLYSYTDSQDGIGAIEWVEPEVMNTWAQVGSLGMGFNRWKWEAATPYKGMGPMGALPPLVQSGVFEKVPERESDAVYGPAVAHRDPSTGLCVELRRGYIALSQPGMGTMVIRNSSHHFGRDLFPEPAYYSKKEMKAGEWFSPEALLAGAGGFLPVLGKELNRTSALQEKHHGAMRQLLAGLERVMETYVDWTSGFYQGTPPPGFVVLLKLALESADSSTQKPFRQGRPTCLAWVHPLEPPRAYNRFDFSIASNLAEGKALLQVLQGRGSVKALESQAGNLLSFLKEGPKKGWQLVLMEP
jgi:hypothetical protein